MAQPTVVVHHHPGEAGAGGHHLVADAVERIHRRVRRVLGRACTVQEKGDWLSYMLSL